MMKQVKKGNEVSWDWGNGTAKGNVVKTATEKTSIQSKGKTINKNGTKDNPAVLIKQDDGTKVLKRKSELE